MANYSNIYGINIPIRSSDPTYPEDGQIWYNSSTNILKGNINYGTGSWSTGGSRNTNSPNGMSLGTLSAAFLVGGRVPPGAPYATSATENYDGTSWTTGTPTGQDMDSGTGEGSQTAAIIAGTGWPGAGGKTQTTYLFTSNSWTTGPSTPGSVARYYGAAGGTGGQSAMIKFNGEAPGGSVSNATEIWNGSSWSSGNNTLVAGEGSEGFGTSTAAVGFSYGPSQPQAYVMEYDGTSWTAGGAFPITGKNKSLGGTLTAGIATGGNGTPDTINALYDGTSWTVSPQSRPIGGAQPPKGEVGTQGSHLAVAVPSPTTATLEWVSGSNVVTISSS
jgi:hypothetical protein